VRTCEIGVGRTGGHEWLLKVFRRLKRKAEETWKMMARKIQSEGKVHRCSC